MSPSLLRASSKASLSLSRPNCDCSLEKRPSIVSLRSVLTKRMILDCHSASENCFLSSGFFLSGCSMASTRARKDW